MQFISGLCWIDGNKISRKRGKKKTLIFHGQSLSKNGLELMESSFHNGVYLEKRIMSQKDRSSWNCRLDSRDGKCSTIV